jgi:hypothetical protein
MSENNTIKLGNNEFDLSNVLPLKVRDWRALEKAGIRLGDSESLGTVNSMAQMAQYILKKADDSIADDFVDDLTLDEIAKVTSVATEPGQKIDRPT